VVRITKEELVMAVAEQNIREIDEITNMLIVGNSFK
jgi:hypothetical protein